jgi:mannose-6-phosphate isomerase
MQAFLRLRNTIQNYSWGSRTAIADLLGVGSPSSKPQAELWMGTHPKGPSEVLQDRVWKPLNDLIEESPQQVLGEETARNFDGRLPFLFKILAAERPLSIQAHPNHAQAREGFRRESDQQIPLDAPHRNYRDGNHKPEVICALSEFWALCGFRTAKRIRRYFSEIEHPTCRILSRSLAVGPDRVGLRHFFASLMKLSIEELLPLLDVVQEEIMARFKNSAEAHWIDQLRQRYPRDPGVLSPLFLNLVKLDPGEGLFLPSRLLHAYLGGVGVELMANSDNVLRGGLTDKHVALSELLRVLEFQPFQATVLLPEKDPAGGSFYRTPAREFRLSAVQTTLDKPIRSLSSGSIEIVFCTHGEVQLAVSGQRDQLTLRRGESGVVPASTGTYEVQGEGTLFRAGVPRSD